MVFATVILKLMLYNMAKKPFPQIHFQYIYVLAPICSYLLLGVSPSTEIIVTRVCTALALADFYLSMAIISK